MPVNRNALIRYKTIDKCLQNRYRKWTLDDLIEACSDALYEYEGIDAGVSKRSVQADIQMMRSDKLGYNAPIVVKQRKYYTYEDSEYSITNIPLTDQDLGKLSEAVEFMKQFQGFSHFKELDGLVQKLEDHVYSQKTKSKPVVDIEKNENLKGLEFLNPLYKAIIKKTAIKITYQSFKARAPREMDFHPYLLKEFRNRWFLVGVIDKRTDVLFLALDRIVGLSESQVMYLENEEFDATSFFKDVIGVTASPNIKPEEVLLSISHKHAPYVLTKPLHHSQQTIERNALGVVVSLKVQHNFELEKEILSFGESIKVLAPSRLKRRIKERMDYAIELYETEISPGAIKSSLQQLLHKGTSILSKIYTQRELRKMRGVLDTHFKDREDPVYAQRRLLEEIPELQAVLLNPNLKEVIQAIDKNAFLTKAIYFDKALDANWFVSWHQDISINVKEKKEVVGYSKWTFKEGINGVCPPQKINGNTFTIRVHLDDADVSNGALKVLPGSHKKQMSKEEIEFITSNSSPTLCEVESGGIHLMKPLLLHTSIKTKSQRKRRAIHLEFASIPLDGGLEWLEYKPLIDET